MEFCCCRLFYNYHDCLFSIDRCKLKNVSTSLVGCKDYATVSSISVNVPSVVTVLVVHGCFNSVESNVSCCRIEVCERKCYTLTCSECDCITDNFFAVHNVVGVKDDFVEVVRRLDVFSGAFNLVYLNCDCCISLCSFKECDNACICIDCVVYVNVVEVLGCKCKACDYAGVADNKVNCEYLCTILIALCKANCVCFAPYNCKVVSMVCLSVIVEGVEKILCTTGIGIIKRDVEEHVGREHKAIYVFSRYVPCFSGEHIVSFLNVEYFAILEELYAVLCVFDHTGIVGVFSVFIHEKVTKAELVSNVLCFILTNVSDCTAVYSVCSFLACDVVDEVLKGVTASVTCAVFCTCVSCEVKNEIVFTVCEVVVTGSDAFDFIRKLVLTSEVVRTYVTFIVVVCVNVCTEFGYFTLVLAVGCVPVVVVVSRPSLFECVCVCLDNTGVFFGSCLFSCYSFNVCCIFCSICCCFG